MQKSIFSKFNGKNKGRGEGGKGYRKYLQYFCKHAPKFSNIAF